MTKEHDMIIAGAGTGGAVAGIIAARAGLDVVVIDNKPKQEIGRKVCGNAIEHSHLKRLADIGITFTKKELVHEVQDIEMISPNKQDSIVIREGGYVVDRQKFGQKLVHELTKSGAKLVTETQVKAPIARDGRVLGVVTSKGKLYSNITIDATGFTGVLRQKIPFATDFPKRIPFSDYGKCYREIITTKEPLEDSTRLKVWFTSRFTPGGYVWYFPSGKNKINIGVGSKAPMNPIDVYNAVPKDCEIKSVDWSCGSIVPMRKPLGAYVTDGFMLVGDSACQVNPIDGAGIGYSMHCGAMAAEVAIKNISDPTRDKLWEYNKTFMSGYGSDHAQMEVIMRNISKMSDRGLDFIINKKIMSGKDIEMATSSMSNEMTFSEKLDIAKKAFPRLDLLFRLSKMKKQLSMVKRHYKAYPTKSAHFPRWQAREEEMFARI